VRQISTPRSVAVALGFSPSTRTPCFGLSAPSARDIVMRPEFAMLPAM
jgi:hypothetical protein